MKEETEEADISPILLRVFGDTPTVRVLDLFLIEGMYFDYPISDIAKNARVNKVTLAKILPRLLKLGIIKESRRIGPAKLFGLNKENEVAKELHKFYINLALKFADLEEEKPEEIQATA